MRYHGLAFTCLLVACNPVVKSTPVPEVSHRLSAPMSMKVEGPAQVHPGESIDVTVRLSRKLVTPDPISLSLELPSGVSLVHGLASETIADGSSVEIVRTYTVYVEQQPSADLVVIAQASGASWFTRGTATYGFGRLPPPPVKVQTPQGPDLIIRGANVGPSIPVDVAQP